MCNPLKKDFISIKHLKLNTYRMFSFYILVVGIIQCSILPQLSFLSVHRPSVFLSILWSRHLIYASCVCKHSLPGSRNWGPDY